MPRAPKFFGLLPQPRDVAVNRLEAYARDPSRTIEQCHTWLMSEYGLVDTKELPDHPMAVSYRAVGRWKEGFDETDRMGAAAELADAIHTASTEAGTADVAGGVTLQLAQRMQRLIVTAGDKLSAGDLLKMSMAINAVATTQQRVNKLKQQQSEALKTAEAAAKSGASATDVVTTIKKALGITA